MYRNLLWHLQSVNTTQIIATVVIVSIAICASNASLISVSTVNCHQYMYVCMYAHGNCYFFSLHIHVYNEYIVALELLAIMLSKG